MVPEIMQEEMMEEEMMAEEPQSFSYLALGDSYTIGQGVAEEERWPIQLQAKLLADSIVIDTLDIIARTGWTTTNLLEEIDEVNPAQYDIVSLLIGVNNQFQGKPFSLYEEEFVSLINKAISLSRHGAEGVFVVSIPDYGVTPFGTNNATQIAQELDAYNFYAQEVSENRSIPFINITEISRELGSGVGALATDNLHPSASQYAAWVDEIIPAIMQLFR